MIRTGYIAVFAWAIFYCAPTFAAPGDSPAADTASHATANTQVQTSTAEESRLSKLAQRLADEKGAPPKGGTPTYIDSDDADADADAEAQPASPAPGETPLVSNGTRLFRPGSIAESADGTSERPNSASWFLKTLTSLGVVIGLALFVRWGYARLGGKVAVGSSPVVEVLSRTAVAPRSHVMLLRVGGRVLVVSDSSAGMRTLASLEDAEEVADILGAVSATKPNSISRGFGQILNRFSDDHEQMPDDLDGTDPTESTGGASTSNVSSLLSRVRSMGRQGDST